VTVRLPLLCLLLAACGGSVAELTDEADLEPVQGPSLETAPEEGQQPEQPEQPEPAPTEALEPGDVQQLTFADLSLAGVDVNALLDLMFTGEAPDQEFEFPESMKALDGEAVSIVGYMIALDFEEDRVTRFMLVRDLAACCFGGMPRPDEWIDVTVTEPCPYWVYRPVRVRGHLSVGLAEELEDELMRSVLQIRDGAASAER